MIYMSEKEDMKSLYTKVNELRAEALTKDWTDDKQFIMNGRVAYPYLSADKVKKTIAPLLHKHNLELQMSFSELTERAEVGGFKQHWTIKLDASLIDVDTGASLTTTVYGEAGDVGDKGINKAQTAAIKQWILSEFLVADGIDPECDTPMRSSTYTPKTPEETEEVKSKVLSHTVADEPKAETPAEPQKKKDPFFDAPVKETIATPQQKAMERIINNLTEQVAAGTFEQDELSKIITERDAVKSSAEAIGFIKKYKGLTV